MHRGWIASLVVAVAAIVVIAWLGGELRTRAARPQGELRSSSIAGARDKTMDALSAGDDAPQTRASVDPPTARSELGLATAGADDLSELLALLRELAPEPDFHARAWPLVTAIGDLARRTSDRVTPASAPTRAGPHERLHSLAGGSDADVGRIRAACLIALAIGSDAESVAATLESLRGAPDPEVERAAWLASALDATEPAAHPLAAGELHGPLGLRTFPVAIQRVVARELRAAAIARALRPMSSAWEEPRVLQDAATREELFTRWVAVVAAIGPAAHRPSPERTLLLEWLRARTLPGLVMREVAAFCLAQAAAHDAELLRQLEQTVFETLREEGPELADVLVAATGRADLALSFAREILGGASGVTDELGLAYGFNLLRTALQAENAATREAAQNFAVERLFASDLDEWNKNLLIAQIEAGGPALLLGVAPRVLADERGGANALWTVRALGRIRSGDGVAAARSQLESTYFRSDASAALKLAVLKALIDQDPSAGREFASVQGLGDRDPTVRTQTRALLDEKP
jgi:hypothetical protein